MRRLDKLCDIACPCSRPAELEEMIVLQEKHLHSLIHRHEASAVCINRNGLEAKSMSVWRTSSGNQDCIHFKSVHYLLRVEVRELNLTRLNTGHSRCDLGGKNICVEINWPWVNQDSLCLQRMNLSE